MLIFASLAFRAKTVKEKETGLNRDKKCVLRRNKDDKGAVY